MKAKNYEPIKTQKISSKYNLFNKKNNKAEIMHINSKLINRA